MIYLDNAATSYPKPPQIARAVADAINTLSAPQRGAYDPALAASRALYTCRAAVAALFNAREVSSVVFTSGATEALNAALFGLISPEDRVLVAVTEHNAALRPLYRIGCALDIIPCDTQGTLVFDGLHRLLRKTTTAVVCSHMSNVTGNVADTAFLSRFCRENGLYLIMDCAQSSGCRPVDASLADIVCFSGHKALFGPQGTGGMVIHDAPVKPFKLGGTGQRSRDRFQPAELPERMEAGTQNIHSLSGLLAGVQFVGETGLDAIAEKETALMNHFVNGISENPKISLYGDFVQPTRGAIVSLSVEGYGSAEVSDILSVKYGIATRPGLHCAPLIHEALGTADTGLVRFSFSYFNTPEDADAAVSALAAL